MQATLDILSALESFRYLTNGEYHHLMIYSMVLVLLNPYTKSETVFSFIMPVTVFFSVVISVHRLVLPQL